MKTLAHHEPSVQECLAEDGTPTERLLRLTDLTLLLTPDQAEYGETIPRRRAQRAADYADAWADDITVVEVTPAAPWVHRSVSYPSIINSLGHVSCAVGRLDDGRTSSPQLCYALRALAANVRTFAGLESPTLGDSDPQRDHPHTPPTSQETAMTTTPQRIDEIRDRLNKARPGLGEIDGGEESLKRRGNPKGVYTWTLYGTYADAILLVNARNDIAWLLDALARRDQRCEDLAASLDETRAALDIASRKEDQ